MRRHWKEGGKKKVNVSYPSGKYYILQLMNIFNQSNFVFAITGMIKLNNIIFPSVLPVILKAVNTVKNVSSPN